MCSRDMKSTNSEFSGLTFGNQYQIQDQVDSNGIIHSYRAIQTSLNRPVIVHIVAPEYRSDPAWNQALIRGAEIAAQYAHPNIVPVFDCGQHNGINYAVVRVMEGGTLQTRLDLGPLSIANTVSVVRHIASALDYIHARGQCHGDLAPINIIFDSAGNAYIADFYLMGWLQTTRAFTEITGVPAFMSPERLTGDRPTSLSDQYALAGISYYMLTGELGWNVLGQFADIPVSAQQMHRAEIPQSINLILQRALSRQPEDRFVTVAEFARQFEEALKEPAPHVFISYSRQDTDYVNQLKAFLNENGIKGWVDDQIEHGDQWFNDINNAIKSSGAFLVVMSPDAEKSEWVQKEILLAKRYHTPIFPLLLRGTELPILIDLQFADVRSGQMPDANFHRRVTRALYGR